MIRFAITVRKGVWGNPRRVSLAIKMEVFETLKKFQKLRQRGEKTFSTR